MKRITGMFGWFLVLSIAALIAGCGGGGGGGDGAGGEGTASSAAGTWSMTENSDGDTCGGTAETRDFTLKITVSGKQITIDEVGDDQGASTATLSGHTVTFDIAEAGDAESWPGSTHLVITFSSDWKTLTAEGSWYEDNGIDRCEGTFDLSGTKEAGSSGGEAALLCRGSWVQVNFLGTDDYGNVEEWDADSTDPEGIGFTAVISATQWVERDDFGAGEPISFSYTISGNHYVKTYSWYTETGWLEFPDSDTMIEWFDYPEGATNELVAFKWKRQDV